ncbi:MAG: hypothetical protein U9R64_07885 [Pseudomonadota bacterium]|nr:hypothetical protein [Pseudomonadota bacterium]
MEGLKFQLGQLVSLKTSGEEGHVIGRAEYEASEPSYYVRYRAADGRQVEAWWGESALSEA